MTPPVPFGSHELPVVHAVLESSPNSVLVLDATGVVRHANARALEQLGYAAADLVGRSAGGVLSATQFAPARLAAYLADPQPATAGATHPVAARRADGTTFPAELTLTPLPTESGPHVIVGIADVTRPREDRARLQDLSRAYLTLAGLNQVTVRARDAAELYAESCRVAVEDGDYLAAWVARRGPGDGVRTIARAGVLDDYIDALDLSLDPASPRGRGPTAGALREGRTFVSRDFVSRDFGTDAVTAPGHERAARYGIRASASLPVRRGGDDGEVVAVFTLWSARSRAFDGPMRELLESLRQNLGFALDGFHATAELARVAAERADLVRRLVAAQEEERDRIAAEVHDDSVQALAAVDLRLGLLARRVAEAAPDLAPAVAQVQETVEAVSSGLRRLLFELEPAAPGEPFTDLLRQAADHVFEDADVRWTVEPVVGREPPAEVAGQALRIAREALVVVREGAASTVRVGVHCDDDALEVTLTHDVDRPAASAEDSLARLRDRAEVAGGWLRDVRREGGAGGKLRLRLPHGGG